jgi:hypothetical protein
MKSSKTNFNFTVDRMIQHKAYPALAQHHASPYTKEWRQFAHHWPNTVPIELFEHAQTHNIDLNISTKILPGYYAIGLGFFNFSIDYFSLLPDHITTAIKQKKLKVLFYYHEGDNPFNIQNHLDVLCRKNQLPADCYHFVSGNTIADKLDRFHYFPDHELLYWHRNKDIVAEPIHEHRRKYTFTVLNRTHKWWRATAMADLWRHGILSNSQWSYNFDIDCGDLPEDNPIEIDSIKNLRRDLELFKKECPHTCDDFNSDQHNDHHLHVPAHYNNSYCSIVFETHFDADGSGGAFLTEKTFKCLKHGHPFIIVGAPGSLNTLRQLGYKTFDHAIDSSYDWETDNTQRWHMIREAVKEVAHQDPHSWFQSVVKDCQHNQQLFLSSKNSRVNSLLTNLFQNYD